MEIKLRTLTHVWTGGVDGEVDRIHETGIVGSLRWWYEAIVRGLGGDACDPSKGKCSFNLAKYRGSKAEDERQRLCDVCRVFGATGWRRRFRLRVAEKRMSHANISNQPLEGEFVIRIEPLIPSFFPEVIAGLIQFVADWAALGARPQMGFGVVEPVNGRIDTKPFYDWVTAVAERPSSHDLPSLRNMFFARIHPKKRQPFSEKDTFNLKCDLRQLFAGDRCRRLRRFIMGTVKDKRMAAKVKMSRPYNHQGKSTIRAWGWIPAKADVYRKDWNREKVLERIYDHLKTNYKLEVWREMNSERDTISASNSDVQAFLRGLLESGENE